MNNMEQRNKTHRTTEFSDYWYLREGDFRPEPIANIFGGSYYNKRFLEEMEELGNLFTTKEEAARASEEIRDYLRSRYGKRP